MVETLAVVLVVLGLVLCIVALFALREARAILRSSEALAQTLHSETLTLVREATRVLVGAKADIRRVEDLIEVTEERSMAINSASRLAIGAVAAPIVRVRALRLGVRRGLELFRVKRST